MNAGVEAQAAVLQNAIVLGSRVCASVQLMQKAQALRVLNSQGWEAAAVQSNLFPGMALQVRHKGGGWVISLRRRFPEPGYLTSEKPQSSAILLLRQCEYLCNWPQNLNSSLGHKEFLPFHVQRQPFSLGSIVRKSKGHQW